MCPSRILIYSSSRVCSLVQCCHVFRLSRNRYTESEIQQARKGVNDGSFYLLMKNAILSPIRQLRMERRVSITPGSSTPI